MDEMYTLIRFTGPRFFSLMLPGYTAYILDFLYAANSIISNSDLKGKQTALIWETKKNLNVVWFGLTSFFLNYLYTCLFF